MEEELITVLSDIANALIDISTQLTRQRIAIERIEETMQKKYKLVHENEKK